MNIPTVVTRLLKAQNDLDDAAYADCFSETATVFDEGREYKGKAEIKQWIADANSKYQATAKPLAYEDTATGACLTAAVSGTFPGSPVVLQYRHTISDGLLQSLEITG